MAETETRFEARVKHLAELRGWLYYHTHRSQYSPAGFPDCLMIRDGHIIVAELKVGKNSITADQWEWLDAFMEALGDGAPTPRVFVWWNTDEDWDEICEVLA